MNVEDLQAALDKYDRVGRGLNVLPASEMVLVLEAARLVANPNIEALARLIADHRGVDWVDTTYMDACRRLAEQYVAAALTPGDTDE